MTSAVRGIAAGCVIAVGLSCVPGCSAVDRLTNPSRQSSESSAFVDTAAVQAFSTANPTAAARLKASDIAPAAITAMPDAAVVSFPSAIVIGDLDRQQMATLASDVAQGVKDVGDDFRRNPTGPVLLLAPRTQAEFDALHGPGSTSQLGAFTVLKQNFQPYVVFDAALKVTIETPGSSAAPTDTTQLGSDIVRRKVITHELVHDLTLTYAAREKRPLWLVEGVAEYFGQRASDLTLHPAAATAHLPSNAELTGSGAADAYQLATDFIRFLVQRFGRSATTAFYLSGVDDLTQSLNALAQKTFGKTLTVLTEQWAGQYRRSVTPAS